MILVSLLNSNISCFTLMTGTVSTYVVHELISVLPSDQLEPLENEVSQNFTRLSLDSAGCRVVQALLQSSSPQHQQTLATLLSYQKVLLALADTNGTFVAQDLVQVTPLFRLVYSDGCIQQASTEPGSRLVQEVVVNCSEPHIILSKPAVFVALAVLDKLVEKSIRGRHITVIV